MTQMWNTSGSCEPDVEVFEEAALYMAQATMQQAMNEAQISRSVLAKRMERDRSFITRVMRGSHNLTVKTMARVLFACGMEVRFSRVPLHWSWGKDTLDGPAQGSLLDKPAAVAGLLFGVAA